jgi:hypothetical protein
MLVWITLARIQMSDEIYALRGEARRWFRVLHALPADVPGDLWGETLRTLKSWLEQGPQRRAAWTLVEREWRISNERSARKSAGLCDRQYCRARSHTRTLRSRTDSMSRLNY